MQLHHRFRFLLLPHESTCLVAGSLSAALELSIFLAGHVAVLASTSGWKPSAGFLQYPLVWLFECYSSVNPSLLFQNPVQQRGWAGVSLLAESRSGAQGTPPPLRAILGGRLEGQLPRGWEDGATAGLLLRPAWSSPIPVPILSVFISIYFLPSHLNSFNKIIPGVVFIFTVVLF